jgi:Cys-rich protein (TIGR01571 family)
MSNHNHNRGDEFKHADQDAAALLGTSDAEKVVSDVLNPQPITRPTRAHVVRVTLDGNGHPLTGKDITQKANKGCAVCIPDPRASGGAEDEDGVGEVVAATVTTTATASSTRRRAGPPYFSNGLFACWQNCGVCFEACCCAYCMAGTHHNFLRNGKSSMSCVVCFCLYTFDVALLSLFLAKVGLAPPTFLMCHTCWMRRLLRQRYHLEGEEQTCSLTDLLAVWCCEVCVLAQHQREITARGEWCSMVCCSQTTLGVPGTIDLV